MKYGRACKTIEERTGIQGSNSGYLQRYDGTSGWKQSRVGFVSHRMGAAAILPVMKDGRIVMVRQYRNALERETLEIPAAVGTVRRKIRRIVRHGRWKRKRDTAARM